MEVAFLSVMLSGATISLGNSLDQEKAVIFRTKARLNRMGDDTSSF